MKFDPTVHHRRSIRLSGYDYTQAGYYFITLCAYQKQCIFGRIQNGYMRLNAHGRAVADEWLKTTTIRDAVELDEWVVMPNHFHGILFIGSKGTARRAHGVLPHIGERARHAVPLRAVPYPDN
jgi:putative transposase